jgi:hypothetical protein
MKRKIDQCSYCKLPAISLWSSGFAALRYGCAEHVETAKVDAEKEGKTLAVRMWLGILR